MMYEEKDIEFVEEGFTLDDIQVETTPVGMTGDAVRGDKCCGTITSIDVFQDTEYGTNQPLTFANGRPKLKSCIKLNCYENTYMPDLQGKEVAIYVKHHGDNWNAFMDWVKTQNWWREGMKISNVLKQGAYIEYIFEGKGKASTRDGRPYTYNKYTLIVEPETQTEQQQTPNITVDKKPVKRTR